MPTLAELWDSSDTGLKGDLNDRLEQAKDAYRKQYGKEMPVTSGFRTYEQQAALASKPNPYPVARPGTSMHETGDAVDIGKDVPDSFLNQYGLHRPFKNDPVHVQVMPSAKGTQSLSSLWDQVDVPETAQTEVKQPEKSSLQTAFNAKKEMGQRVAGGLDTLLGIVPKFVQEATYASARAAQRSPEEATKFSEQMGSYFQPKIGQALGVQNTEAYQHPLGSMPGKVAEYVNHLSNVLGLTPEQISEKTGIPASDIRNMAFTASIAAPEALGAIKAELPKVDIVKGESQVANQLKNQLQQKGAQNVGAAQTVNKSVLDQAIASASPELAAELKNVNPSNINLKALNAHLEADSLPKPMRLTEGQAKEDPILISKERNERGYKEQFAQRFNEQNKDLMDNAIAIKEKTAPDVYGPNHVANAQNTIDIVSQKIADNEKNIKQAYNDLNDFGAGKIAVDSKTFAQNAKKSLDETDDLEFLPSQIASKLEKYSNGKEMNFNQFENLRTQIARESRKADRAEDGNAVHALALVRNELEKLPLVGETAEAKLIADKARGLAKNNFNLLNKDLPTYNPLYAKVFNNAADTKNFIVDNVLNSKNMDFAKTMDILKDNPEAIQNLRQGTLDWMIRDSTDASGNFSTGKFSKHIQNLDVNGKLNQLFGEDADVLNKLARTGQRIEARPKGSFVNESNTATALGSFAKEYGNKLLTEIPGVKHVVAPVTLAKEVIAERKSKKSINEALKPGAGINIKDIGK